jgi:putative ABC transport system substrate-binding protein
MLVVPIKVPVLAAKMRSDMTRREFIGLLGGVAAWPLAARAQQAGKLPTIGFLGPSTAASWERLVADFEQRLREFSWIEGRAVLRPTKGP